MFKAAHPNQYSVTAMSILNLKHFWGSSEASTQESVFQV